MSERPSLHGLISKWWLNQSRSRLYDVLMEMAVRMRFLEEALSLAQPPSTEPATKASPSAAPASLTETPTLAFQLQPGDLMVADLFHAAYCSECADLLARTLSEFRTHALVVDGVTLTSVEPDSSSYVGALVEAAATSASRESSSTR